MLLTTGDYCPGFEPSTNPEETRKTRQRRCAPLKLNCTTNVGSIRFQPLRLFQTNSHFRLGAIETKSWWGTGTERSLGITSRNGTKGFACNACSMAPILMLHTVVPVFSACQRLSARGLRAKLHEAASPVIGCLFARALLNFLGDAVP